MNYQEPLILSVSQLNRYVKARMDEDENLYNVFLTGEISNFTRHFKTGHLYFTLKDASAAVKCVMFSSNAIRLKFEPQNGLHILVRGRVTLYEAAGQYQVYVDDMQPEGLGAYHLAFEQTKERLQKAGIFDDAHKKSLPKYPKRIGVITSKVGAALQDILNILNRRYPLAEVILAPVAVQGEGAHLDMIHAIEQFDRTKIADVLILGRGGGSVEDLWEFNNEDLALAIYYCETPIISAVGHETDFTISDFVADLRAPTPSAAAEMVVPNQLELKSELSSISYRLQKALSTFLMSEKSKLQMLSTNTALANPSLYFDTKKMQFSLLSGRFYQVEQDFLQSEKIRLSKCAAKLDALSPLAVLSRGYAIAKTEEDTILKSTTQVKCEDSVAIQLKDGTLACVVKEIL